MGSIDRTVALSVQLARAHQDLRRQIKQLKANLGRRPPAGRRLATHCLAFCAALTAHHQGEDTGMFVDLLRERPDLAGVIANLVEDHEMITTILARVAELADEADVTDDVCSPGGPALEAIGRELDGLTAIMESHFHYEERAIGKPLDKLTE